jgi:ribonuclease BN (tRNA processing enzyme)
MDLVALRYGLKYGRLRADPALTLLAPPGARDFFRRLGSALDGDPAFFDGTYTLSEYRPRVPLELAGLTLQFMAVKHYIPSFGVAVSAGRRLAFSSDAAPCPELVELARGVDLFLCEAAIDTLADDDPDPERRGHMTALEAAELARQAGAARLLLTHYRAAAAANGKLAARAGQTFGGPVEFAVEGRSYWV